MVEEVRSVSAAQSANLPKKGIKMSDLQQTNKALYEYFKQQGIKEDAYVTQENIQQAANALFGLELGNIPEEPELPENTEIRDDQGDLKQTVAHDKTDAGLDRTTTTNYFGGKKSYADIEFGQNKIHIQYNNNELPKRQVESFKGDSESFRTTEYSYENGARTETITYQGKFIKDGVTTRTIVYDKDGNITSNTTNLDEPETPEVAAAKQEPQAEPIAFQKFKVPAGWSISDIAKAYGISVDDVLKANVDANGKKAYRTTKTGTQYFYKDQEINIPANAKLNPNYKRNSAPKTPPPQRTNDGEWHAPLMTPEQQARADAERAAAAERQRKADDFGARLNGEKPLIEEEQTQVPLMTPSQQRAADAARARERARQQAQQRADDFGARLNGEKPLIEEEQTQTPLMTPSQQRAADAARARERARQQAQQKADDFGAKLRGEKPWM